ncbi:hypothetical protein BXZ70DRAFT_16356 [Cristinia sonorae]|uniref:Uncharacterized protein n=1 Tax=Cristinia sonorae TaxID=1940300 RepID=A0A8K0V1L5_9AGAR|nr:hypothetical protein BXZ70DRAFT_16356 [Cristinia sonorae]
MPVRNTILDLFPVELLAMIKEYIPQGQLMTHINFYLSFPPVTPSLYGNDEQQELFWEKACAQAGLGYRQRELNNMQQVSWRRVVWEEIVNHLECDHVECGQGLLQFVSDAMESQITIDLNDCTRTDFFSVIPDSPDKFSNGTIVNPVLGFIHFPDKLPGINVFQFFERDMYLYDPKKKVQDPARQLLDLHPIAARSWATFPPSRRVLLSGTYHNQPLVVENVFGVTVWDVHLTLQRMLEDELSAKQLQQLLDGNDYRSVFPPECDFLTLMGSLTTLRQFLTFYRIKEIEFVDWDVSGLHLCCNFEPIRKANPKTKGYIY